MECAVIGSNLNSIKWYFSSSNIVNIFDEDVLEITDNSKYTLESVASTEILRVTLTVNNLNEENDTGTYYCRAFLLDGTMLDSPNSFELKESEAYEVQPFPCSPNVALKSAMSVCARPYIPTTTEDVSTTPSPSPTYSTMVLLPTTSRTPAAGITTMPSSTMFALPTVASSNSSPIPILYIVIGPLGFLTTMCIIMGFVICLLCKRGVRNQGKSVVFNYSIFQLCYHFIESGQSMELGCINQ